jgi:uncharacterized protein (DUF58 family)
MKTRRRWFITWILILLIAGLATGEKIIYMGLIILLSMVAYAALTNLWVIRNSTCIEKVTPVKIKKGEQCTLYMDFYNDFPLLFPYIKLWYRTPDFVNGNMEKEAAFCILPFSKHEIKEEFTCTMRGEYRLGAVRIEVHDIFGLFTFRRDYTSEPEYKSLLLTVLPRIIPLPYLPLPQIREDEGTLKQDFLDTEELVSASDARQYRYGDVLKKIHWKISSKHQEIYVKNYETLTHPHIQLFLETFPHSIEDKITVYEVEDQIVECTTAIAHYILSKFLSLELVTYDKERHSITGKAPEDFERFYNYLAFLPFDGSFTMSQILNIESVLLQRGRSIIMVVHNLTPSLFNHLNYIKQSGINLTVFFIQHRKESTPESFQIIDQLNEKGILSIQVFTDQRFDQALEGIL